GADAVPVLGGRWLPPRLAPGHLRFAQLGPELSLVHIDFDDVPVAEERDRPARRRLRGDVSHHQAVGRARETPVGYEGNLLRETSTDYRGSDREHLAHPRAALRPLV